MAANTTPIHLLTPNVSSCTIAAANTARDGSGTLVTLFTAGADGSRVERIVFISAQATAATNSAMIWRVFITDTSGANPRLWREVASAATAASNTVVGSTQEIYLPGGLALASGQIIKVTQSVYAGAQDQTHVFAEGGNY